jgi:hypothetical protein
LSGNFDGLALSGADKIPIDSMDSTDSTAARLPVTSLARRQTDVAVGARSLSSRFREIERLAFAHKS